MTISRMSNNTKRLTKNTLYMYIRMAVLMVVTLYTSRVILNKLGIEDYGIYNVVGSVILMFNSLRGIFASSAQRFLNYEMGKGNAENLSKVFNISIQINVLIAIVFFLLVEAVGLYFVSYKMNVDPSRLTAVHWVLQFSILGAVASIFTTSFDAVVIAHERMGFYAYLSIVEALLKLSICYVIGMFDDMLIAYGFFMMLAVDAILIANIVYCRRHFSEVRFLRVWDLAYMKKMMIMAGWNFLGNSSYAIANSGLNMVLNVFGGPVVNAARGVAYQVNNALCMITNNISVVVKPFTIKTYAEGDEQKTMRLTFFTTKLYFTVQLLVVIVFTVFLRDIIQVWLGQVPMYLEAFLMILLWHTVVRSMHGPIDLLFYSVGDLKIYQICEGICLSLPVLAAYVLLSLDMPYYTAFLSVLSFEILNLFLIVVIAHKVCRLSQGYYFKNVMLPCAITFGIYAGCLFIQRHCIPHTVMMRMVAVTVMVLSTTSFMYFKGLTENERGMILALIDNIKDRKNKKLSIKK